MIPCPGNAYDNACCESFASDKRPEYAPKLDHAPEASRLIDEVSWITGDTIRVDGRSKL
jgi:hypothetical protein